MPFESNTERSLAFETLQPELEEALKEQVGRRRSPLWDMLRYQMGWLTDARTGELPSPALRVHGLLCLLAANAVSGSYKAALQTAAGVELAQAFVAIHEDLRLGNPDRGERPALWWVWGHSQGINAGDGMYALARLSLMEPAGPGGCADTALRAMAMLDEACLAVCEGQYTEIDLVANGRLGVTEYLHIAEGESGALAGAAAGIGALVAGSPEKAVNDLQRFGRCLGTALRVRQEIDVLWGRDLSPSAASIIEALDKRRSLPILRALETPGDQDWRMFEAMANRKQAIEDRHLAELLDMLERSGAKQFAESTVQEYLDKGLESLASAGLHGSGTRALTEFACHLVNRAP